MTKGDIVLITFPFTDLSGSKLRPSLVLTTEKSDVTVSFITSNLKEVSAGDLVLKAAWYNGLRKDSLLKLNKIVTFDIDLVIVKIGRLNKSELKEVDKKLIEVFKINV